MLLAHLADIHLGYRQYYRQTAAGINQREADVARAFARAIDGVVAKRPDVVVVAGDLFHSVRPTNQAIVHCFHQFQRLKEGLPRARVVVIAGNHDTPRATETGTILRLFAELGIEVVTDQAERLVFPELDLAVLAAPHPAIVAAERHRLEPQGTERYQVLVVHGEVDGLFPLDRWWAEPGGALLDPTELAQGGWSYVALGHYHVMREVKPRIWYAGALDYVTPNPWGELIEQQKTGVPGKGWLLVDLDSGRVERQYIEGARRLIDLKAIDGRDRTAAELDQAIQERLASVKGGIDDQLVRLVVHDVPRHLARDLDHAAIRAAKAKALHFHLDLRRPDVHRTIGVGAPGPRQTLTDVVRGFLARRPLPDRVDRDRFVERGVSLLESVSFEPEPGA
ncbi:MAG: DNA repair exonuclease [Gemmatimonadetes bacterium]|nr:DNA repair exonuclease [Gemmatimonadota bacterium]